MKILISLLLFIFQTIWGNNFKVAQKRSQQENKPILIYFSGSDWCGPCIQLKKEVFSKPEFEEFASKNIILLQADFPRLKKNALPSELQIQNDELAQKYNSKGIFPLSVLIDKNGKILKEWQGYPKTLHTESFIQSIQTFL